MGLLLTFLICRYIFLVTLCFLDFDLLIILVFLLFLLRRLLSLNLFFFLTIRHDFFRLTVSLV